MTDKVTSSYLHELQAIYNRISNRGICLNKEKLRIASLYIDQEIQKNLKIASDQWNCHVYIGRDNDDGSAGSVNLNATQGEKALLKKMKDELGYEVPKITKKDSEGNYEQKYSTGELALQKMLVKNQFNFTGGDPAIKAILKVRELGKLKSSYFAARKYETPDGLLLYLSNYNVAGTLTGRRSSKKHTFGYGNNAQNFPKHGTVSKIFRSCLISRPGNIFLFVDQKSAEEWPVNALANNQIALAELRNGINRHTKRALYLFNLPPERSNADDWKDGIEYYMGKKVGHANNYGMRGNRMSDSLAQEGKFISPAMCQVLLDRANILEPNIQGVFHKYIQNEINNSRVLKTPFGRERQFLGVRPNDNNYSIFNEAYAYIPQSVVGDNTGFAVRYLESVIEAKKRAIVQEGHDSIVQDIPDSLDQIWFYLQHTISAFDRVIRFYNGIEVQIPVEAELGYDFATTVKLKTNDYAGLVAAYKKLQDLKEKQAQTLEPVSL